MSRYVFDLDGTLVSDVKGKYELTRPLKERIAVINELYLDGHIVIIMTARGTTSRKERYHLTKQQLLDFGILHHELIVGYKPSADYFIDDKGINADDWFEDKEKAEAKVKTVDHTTEHTPLDLPIRFEDER